MTKDAGPSSSLTGAEESHGAKGVDIGQDMVPLFSQHMGGEAEKRWIILHDKHCQRADGARAQQLGCAGETAWKLRHEETRGLLCPEVCADRI